MYSSRASIRLRPEQNPNAFASERAHFNHANDCFPITRERRPPTRPLDTRLLAAECVLLVAAANYIIKSKWPHSLLPLLLAITRRRREAEPKTGRRAQAKRRAHARGGESGERAFVDNSSHPVIKSAPSETRSEWTREPMQTSPWTRAKWPPATERAREGAWRRVARSPSQATRFVSEFARTRRIEMTMLMMMIEIHCEQSKMNDLFRRGPK